MLESVYKTVKKYNMLSSGDTVVIGVSGGADSLALLCLLDEMSEEFGIKLHAVHINHCLRGADADADQAFVEAFCNKRNIICTSFVYNVKQYAKENGLSSEEAGRILRYKAFESVAAGYESAKIATAHHLSDNCETVLHNILRGSGTTGLAGIRPVRGVYIRPLIETTKSELEGYLVSMGIQWCTDKTNSEAIYTRNKIRLELIPYLKEHYNASIESALCRLSSLCREDDDYLHSCTAEEFKRCCKSEGSSQVMLDKIRFGTLHTAIKRRLIRYILEFMKIPLKDVHLTHIDDCIQFIRTAQSGSFVKVSRCTVQIQQSGVLFSQDTCQEEDYSYSISAGQTVFISSTGQTITCTRVNSYVKTDKNTVFINADGTNGIFEVRNRKSGDKIRPFGLNGTKKLKDYFIDNKIDVCVRNKIPLIVYNNEVVWIAGMCLNENYKITGQTENILKFEIK